MGNTGKILKTSEILRFAKDDFGIGSKLKSPYS
jgi:hypothetical protein